jgi:hypothetical protein
LPPADDRHLEFDGDHERTLVEWLLAPVVRSFRQGGVEYEVRPSQGGRLSRESRLEPATAHARALPAC